MMKQAFPSNLTGRVVRILKGVPDMELQVPGGAQPLRLVFAALPLSRRMCHALILSAILAAEALVGCSDQEAKRQRSTTPEPEVSSGNTIDSTREAVATEADAEKRAISRLRPHAQLTMEHGHVVAVFFEGGEGGETPAYLQELPKLPALRSLVIHNTYLGDEGAKYVGQCKSLTTLRLNAFVYVGSYSNLVGLTKLKELYVHDISVQGVDAISRLTTLEVLSFAYPESEAQPLSKLASLQDLRELGFRTSALDSRVFEKIKPLQRLSVLQWVGLEGHPDGFRALAMMPRLEQIYMTTSNGFPHGSKGFEHLRAMREVSRFVAYSLPLRRSELEIIAQWKHLERLALDGRHITLDGLRALTDLQELKALKLLGDKWQHVTVDEVRTVLPQVREFNY
jgi:hypothetical protein